jgi:cytochrome c-type biogenesis protein CcmH
LKQSPVRLFSVLVAFALASCGGQSSPPPPAATPAAGEAGGGMRPLTSRDTAAPASSNPHGTAPAGPVAETPALPAGHPPIGAMPGASGGAAATAAAGPSVAGTIAVSPKVQSRLAPTDVLYLIAKKDGSTLAVQRVAGPQFPLPFEISGADAMVAGTAFAGPVELIARVSKSGDAIASAGDLEGTRSGIAVPATGITVTIDTVRP